MMTTNPLTHTYRSAATELRLSERTVWQLVRDGHLRAVRIGAAVRIPYSELIRFLEAKIASPSHYTTTGEGEVQRECT